MLSKVVCPQCGNGFDLQQAWDDADGRRFAEVLTQLPPPLIRPVYQYLKLFKPKKRSLSWSRILKLLHELAPMIHAAEISRNGVAYRIPAELWASGIKAILESKSVNLPLDSHGYLLEILAKTADKQAAIQEEQIEEQRRQGLNRPRQDATDSGLKPVSAVVKRNKPPDNWAGTVKKGG